MKHHTLLLSHNIFTSGHVLWNLHLSSLILHVILQMIFFVCVLWVCLCTHYEVNILWKFLIAEDIHTFVSFQNINDWRIIINEKILIKMREVALLKVHLRMLQL